MVGVLCEKFQRGQDRRLESFWIFRDSPLIGNRAQCCSNSGNSNWGRRGQWFRDRVSTDINMAHTRHANKAHRQRQQYGGYQTESGWEEVGEAKGG